MIQLNLPSYQIKLAGSKEKPTIFDILRRKYVALTPEEWVRQHFVHFLVEHKGYPSTLLANEVKLQVGDKKLRADTVLYDTTLRPRLVVEYKAPHITITQEVFNQITTYNMLLHVDFLIVSNGLNHYCCRMDYEHNTYEFLPDIPNYEDII
ncbi:MAG: type I restriction enzyme HsdR N-terminal domain-containing protein [Prevotella sp.]|nr:type I restriction enzyme HsdR N-terminal domain-containing protein [Prevotella sp.]